MDVRFIAPDLAKLDELKREAIAVPMFEDERPLRGALGLIDWRMGGFMSKLILRGRLSGAMGETLLVPVRPRLSFEKVFVFGVGKREDCTEEVFASTVERMLTTLTRARVRLPVMGLPGRAFDLIAPDIAMETLLRIAQRHPDIDEITLVEGPEAERWMSPVIEREKRRARASFAGA